jgi:hydroxyethylthiazole kinase-like uncharacterized protein yjeF
MQKLFNEVSSLDNRCYEKFHLTEDILMEHAANGMAEFIYQKFEKGSKVFIVVGSGNNGADGIALARLLNSDFDVSVFYVKKPKSHMAILQKKRAEAIGIVECNKLTRCDILVDAIVGTGFNGEFNENITYILKLMNSSDAYKIACDVPSGYKFYADATLTMGALKKDMYLDKHKDCLGNIKVLNLGVSRDIYETNSNWNLLDMDDLSLPYRSEHNTHKGSYGHLVVISGEKSGASIMSSKSALRFGVGLVTIVGFENIVIPESLMYSHQIPKTCSAIAIGMGLGNEFSDIELNKFLDNSYSLIADADVFTNKKLLLKIINRENIVFTPHPKEFVSALKYLDLAEIDIEELQDNRFKYVELFCKKYPNTTLLLKGANVIIGNNDKFYINPFGSAKLAKGGSGDVLSGLIGSLLAQGYECLEATINASLAHTKLAQIYTGSDFSLTPDDLINGISNL